MNGHELQEYLDDVARTIRGYYLKNVSEMDTVEKGAFLDAFDGVDNLKRTINIFAANHTDES